MNWKSSVFFICVKSIIYLLLYNLHDCTFKEYFRQAYSEHGPRSKMECFGKIIIVFAFFGKNSILDLWNGSEYVSDFEYVKSSEYLYIFVNKTGFCVYIRMQLWKGPEYCRIPSMSGFCLCKCCTRFWIFLNTA